MSSDDVQEILLALKEQRGLLVLMERRLKHVEADMAILRSAYVSHSKVLGDIMRATPVPIGEEP